MGGRRLMMLKKLFWGFVVTVLVVFGYMLVCICAAKPAESALDDVSEIVVLSLMYEASNSLTGEQRNCNWMLYEQADAAKGFGLVNCWYMQIMDNLVADLGGSNLKLANEALIYRGKLNAFLEQAQAISYFSGSAFPWNPIQSLVDRFELSDLEKEFLAANGLKPIEEME